MGDLTFDAPRAGLQPPGTCFNTRKSMNENIYTGVIVIIALIVIFTGIVLIPQAIGLGIYRLLKPRAGLFAALAGFFLPLILYGAVIGYFWYFAAPTPAEELPGGEGDLVGPAIAFFGFIANVGGGLSLYAYLLAKNPRRPPVKNKSGASDLP